MPFSIPGDDPFLCTRPPTIIPFPPRSSSTPTTAQQTPSQHAATTTPEYPPAVSPVHRPNIGRTEPLFASQRLSTPMSASNPATIEYPPIGSTVRDSVSERPASTTTSIPPRPSSSSASTQPTTSHSPPETQSHTTRGRKLVVCDAPNPSTTRTLIVDLIRQRGKAGVLDASLRKLHVNPSQLSISLASARYSNYFEKYGLPSTRLIEEEFPED
ncbi:hypothetical protein TMatcc_002659 [Talaromyces marneffei ATCC 18224]